MSTGAFITELKDAIENGSATKRTQMLKQVTDLFLHDADRLNDHHTGVFDDVLVQLIHSIETKARIALSVAIAPVANAPVETVRHLARDDDIEVAGPVLTLSPRISDDDLIEVARNKSPQHLLAISGRTSLASNVTDALVDRGDHLVLNRLVANSGAEFSRSGFSALGHKAETDGLLAEKLGLRRDIPVEVLRELLGRATAEVRTRLLASAPPEQKDRISVVLAAIAGEIGGNPAGGNARNVVEELNRNGKLTESVLCNFARERMYNEMVDCLALFCRAKPQLIELLMQNESQDGLVLACKAADLSWPTVEAVLQTRQGRGSAPAVTLDGTEAAYAALPRDAAQRTLRFMALKQSARSKSAVIARPLH